MPTQYVRATGLAVLKKVLLYTGAVQGVLFAVTGPAVAQSETGLQSIDIAQFYLPVFVTTAAVMLAIGAVLWAQREVQKAARREGKLNRALASLEARFDRNESILAAEPGALFVWTSAASGSESVPDADEKSINEKALDAPRLLGRVSGLLDPATGGSFTGMLETFKEADRRRLIASVKSLRENGDSFSMVVRTEDGRAYDFDGRPASDQVVVWVRDASAEQEELSTLRNAVNDLERKRDVLEQLLNALPFPIWHRDKDLNLDYANAAFATAVDAATPAEALAQQATLDSHEKPLCLTAKEQERMRTERRHVVMQGDRRALDLFLAPIQDGVGAIAVDQTRAEDAEQDLTRHTTAHKETLNKLRSAVAIFGPDQRLTFSNRAYARQWRLDEDWLETGPKETEILDLLREARRLPEQANFPAWKRQRAELYSKVIDQPEELWHLPDGRTLRVICQSHPFGGLIYLYEDVTDQLALESSFKLLINVQRATLDNLYEAVAFFGSDGRLKLFNAAYARIWELDPQQLDDEPHFETISEWSEPLHGYDPEWSRMAAPITDIETERRPVTGQLERQNGSMIQYAAMPLPDGATLLTFMDVTDSVRAERALRERNEALEQADKLKSEFVSHMSYQLRTPLNTILGFSTMLQEGINSAALDDKQQEYVGNVLQASNHLLRLIDDILDLATIEAGRMVLDLENIDLAKALNEAVPLAQEWAQEQNVRIVTDIGDGLGRVDADGRRIKQVVLNLASNAIAFSPRDSEVTIGAKRLGTDIRIWVEDNGAGIAPRAQATAFNRFESKGRGDGRRGAGLGLSLVKSFVELHGGWVELESSTGKGTRVTCHLPSQIAMPHDQTAAE